MQTANKPPKIFYVGAFRFPDGDAGAHRVYGIGKALRGAGYEVVFLGAESEGRRQDAVPGGGYLFDGFQYLPAGSVGSSPLQKARRLWHTHVSGLSAMSRLNSLWTESSVAVIAYQTSSPLLAQLRRFCHRRGAVLVSDVVEWYDRSHVIGGRFGPFALDNEYRMRFMNKRSDGVIAISRYLEDYYGHSKTPVLRVPALINLEAACWHYSNGQPRNDSSLHMVFVGNAGQKDLVVNAIRGIALLGPQARECELTLVGPSIKELPVSLGREVGLLETLHKSVRVVGRVPHVEALKRLAQADFSIILRPDQRFAKAGFPTKLVESLAMSVPVICNVTSDIGIYVRDGQEGLLVKDCSPEAFAAGMRRAIVLSLEQRMTMRACARQRAQECFDYRNWVGPLAGFMAQLLQNHRRGGR